MTKEQIKALVERYPYLLPRNVWTDKVPDDYDYTYIKGLEIPKGWYKLFFQLCEDIRQPLIDAGYLEKFRFSQIKEKYNRLECYNFGASEKVQEIIDKYSVMAGKIVSMMGDVTSEYYHCYSELTGYLWTTEKFVCGGHDIPKILRSHFGEYVHMEIELYRPKKKSKGQ